MRNHVGRSPTYVIAVITAMLLIPCAAARASEPRVLYVRADAQGIEDGSCWSDAFVDLQDALDMGRQLVGDGPVEIWVAGGVYTPDRGTGDREVSFELTSGVSLYGGFAGDETDRCERDWAINETILSGDLLGDDDPNFVPESSCCYGTNEAGCDNAACEERVIAEYPDDRCANQWSEGCSNTAKRRCCEICRTGRCDNSISVVSAIGVDASTALDGIVMRGGEGNTEFRGGHGSGLYAVETALEIRNCVFRENAGSALYDSWGDIVVDRCTFTRNMVYGAGSAMMSFNGDPLITDSDFIDNDAGGISSEGSLPIERCRFIDNDGPGLFMLHGSPHIIDCDFIGNHAKSSGGGMWFGGGFAQLRNCRFLGNTAGFQAGGVHIVFSGGAVFVNCIFAGNRAVGGVDYPGGPFLPGQAGALTNLAPVELHNCIFYGNSAGRFGGISQGETLTMSHSILWGNRDDDGTNETSQFRESSASWTILRYNNIQGWTGEMGDPGSAGNFSIEPRFVDPDGPDDILGTADDDFRLMPDSPMINAGEPNPAAVPFIDFDYHERILCGVVDLGAHEFGIGDYDCDRVVDLLDFGAWSDCMTGPDNPTRPPLCEAFDYDADDDIDLRDAAGFQRTLPGG